MAGNGHSGRSKAGRNVVLKSPDTVMGLDLPATRPDGREWLDLTKRWYRSMQTGPMAPRMGMEADWFSLMDLAKLKDDYWRMSKPSAVMAAEIRQREDSFLITPAARIKAKIEAIEADDMSTGTERPETRGEAVKEDVDRRRSQLRVVNGGA